MGSTRYPHQRGDHPAARRWSKMPQDRAVVEVALMLLALVVLFIVVTSCG